MKLQPTLAAALLATFPLAGHCGNQIDLGLSGISLEVETPSLSSKLDVDGPQAFIAGRTDFGVLPVFFGYDVSYGIPDGSFTVGPATVDADLDLLQVRTGLGYALKLGNGELYGRADFTHYGYSLTLTGPGGAVETSENDDGLGVHIGGALPLGAKCKLYLDAGYLDLSDSKGPEAQVSLRSPVGGVPMMVALRYTQLKSKKGPDTDTDVIDLRIGFAIGTGR